ncbi:MULTISPECIES: Ger(x)C family spore germination protein [Anoxybacillus]|uniref:Germination protein, Ger(X)C family n=1 Tax=Anoxybacillus ayderensis TaxID=265546 RepID=A0A0D0HIW1_9BACL|nr:MULTISPECIES: Ger(x)C family spore germination protein [Anoxybacillus]EPZ37437.1 spore germination protein GerKC [Anoxybacillus ayderensis]KIP20154.1 germination protein, Ger(x)C family [Anoxybacillus ayderensis]NNU97599.1 Ger(x)C family spore germination protein [Anoxybacillus sp. EFIL]
MTRALICCFFCFLLTGCWGMKEIDHLAYIHAIGVDYKDGQVIAYAQLISFTGLAKAEAGGGRQKSTVTVGKAKGETFNVATDRLYYAIQQRVSWGHVKGIVFTERALKKGLVRNVIDVLDRYNEIRHTIWAFTTKESIEHIFETTPFLDYSPYFSLLANPTDIYEQSSFIQPKRLNQLIAASNEKAVTFPLPSLAVETKSWTENKKKKQMLKIDGVCFLHRYDKQACLPRHKLDGLRWVTKGTGRTPIYIQPNGNMIGTLVVRAPKASISYKIKDGHPVFTVDIQATGSIIELREQMSEKQIIEYATKTVEKEIKSLFQHGVKEGVDTLQLSNALYRQNVNDWRKYTTNGFVSLTNDTLEKINVKLSIDTYGKSKK